MNYYTIISRDEFIKLYRFGNIKVNTNFILNDDNDIENRIIELFKISSLEYEEGYLILKVKDNIMATHSDYLTIKTIYTLKLKNIKSVYVLTSQAQQFYKTKVNSKVNFQICPFENILKQVSEFKKLQNINQGIDIMRKEFDFINIDEINKKLDNDFISDFLKYDDYLSLDFKDFYFDLLLYKRENFFPKDDVSYIYDLMIITSLRKRNLDSINKFKQGQLNLDGSPAYQKLSTNKKETLFESIKFIQETDDKNIENFTNKITFNHLVTGVIFLKIKKLLTENDDNTQEQILKIVDSFSNDYKDSLSMALCLIGLVFGYKNLYENYYDFIELDIFKHMKDEINPPEQKDDLAARIKVLEDKNKELSQKLIDSKNELKIYKEKANEILNTATKLDTVDIASTTQGEQESTITSKIQIISDKKNNAMDMTDSVNTLVTVPTVINNVQDEKLNIDDSKVTDQKTIEGPQNLGGNPGISEIEEKLNKESFQFTEEEIIEFSLSHLQKIAKGRGVNQTSSKKKYPNSDEGKRALYRAIKNSGKLLNETNY